MSLLQGDKSSVRRAKSAGIEVELPEMRVKIHMKPLAGGIFCPVSRLPYQRLCNALTLESGRHHCVENKRVDPAIPCDVNEPDELPQMAATHPAETEAVDLRPPVIGEQSMLKALGVKGIDLSILERSPPFGRKLGRGEFLR